MSTEGAAFNMPERAKTHSMDAMEHGIRVASRDLELPAVESGSHATTACWRNALDNVVPACVVLKVTQTRSFDTEVASSSYATGFVVDKTRGIILTNRHVVTPGPVTAEAIFLDREEVPVLPVYYDPVHDFGFMRFDPSMVQFMTLHEVPLAPQAAAVGLEVRVVGNDSGEKISILAGTLARLDRDAPFYGRKQYNDFNTCKYLLLPARELPRLLLPRCLSMSFAALALTKSIVYLQAGSGSKGGSSGSPVVDCNGQAVALNAGGKDKASSAFYLPLDRVVRAMRLIQEAAGPGPDWFWGASQIPRGDLQTTFLFKGFDEARRLGLNRDTEAHVRAALTANATLPSAPGAANSASTGMLVVDSIVPGSHAEHLLEPGDVLIKVEGRVVTHFLTLEDILDSAVNKAVVLEVERGGQPVRVTVQVQDLHAVTPASFLEASGSVIHGLSYQQARNSRMAGGQVYLAEAGYLMGQAGVPKHSVLISLATIPTPDVTTFARVLASLPSGARPVLQYFTLTDRHRKKNAVLHLDHSWYGQPKMWTRDDTSGCWTSQQILSAPRSDSPAAQSLQSPQPEQQQELTRSAAIQAEAQHRTTAAEAAAPVAGDAVLDELLRRSLVLVEVEIPHVALMDGVHAKSFAGNGVIVHSSQGMGLIVVDRSTVPVNGGNITLSFGAYPDEIAGRVRFLHPLHNFAIVSYNPGNLSRQAQQQVQAMQLSSAAVKQGDKVQLSGLTQELRLMKRTSTVTTASHAIRASVPTVPRFRPVHEEVIELDHDFGDTFSGVLTDSEGHMTALWANFNEQAGSDDMEEYCRGIPVSAIKPWLQQVCNTLCPAEGSPEKPVAIRVGTLDAELEPLVLSKASQHGLDPCWVTRLAKLDPQRRQV
ncbi:hypothetical protein ABBQ38_009528 [Trebouxia sp. C0009 RCD-2024]